MLVDLDLIPGDSVRALESLTEAFEVRSIRYALIGGLAAILRGRPRYTQDVDFLVDVPQIVLPKLLDDLLDRGATLDPTVVIGEYVRESMTSFPFESTGSSRCFPSMPEHSPTPHPWNGRKAARSAWPRPKA
jgi:hypothetical protein